MNDNVAESLRKAVEDIYRSDSRRLLATLAQRIVHAEAHDSYRRVLDLTRVEPERRFIERRLSELGLPGAGLSGSVHRNSLDASPLVEHNYGRR